MVSPSTREKKTRTRVSQGDERDILMVGKVGILTGKYLGCQMGLGYMNLASVG